VFAEEMEKLQELLYQRNKEEKNFSFWFCLKRLQNVYFDDLFLQPNLENNTSSNPIIWVIWYLILTTLKGREKEKKDQKRKEKGGHVRCATIVRDSA
jgi:hypothetical protein